MMRLPSLSTRAVQYTVSRRAAFRNAVFSSEVTASCSRPMWRLIASHMAQSAAAMKAGPFTVPPGRSSARRKGIAIVHSASEIATSFNP